MKSFFMAIILTACMLAGIAAAGMAFYKSDKNKALNFAIDAANDISVSWDVNELKKRAHPVMIKNLTESGHQMADYFAVLKQIGVLKTIMNCTPVRSYITDFPSFHLDADYSCHGEYEKGDATLMIGLEQDKITGPWRIARFQVDSPVFAPHPANP